MRRWVTLLACLGGLAWLGGLAGWSGMAPARGDEVAATQEKMDVLEEQALDEAAPETAEEITPAEAATVDPEGDAPLEDALTCLARTVYWEAKGEEVAAMEAVASVVMNRLASDDFPKTVCEVVTEGKDEGPCQFSWWCDGSPDDVEEPERFEMTMEVARRALNQELTDRTDGALFFHGQGSTPDWAADYVETVTVGEHVFYRVE